MNGRFPTKRTIKLGACVAMCLVGSACGPSGLTRARAKEAIQAHLDPNRLEVVVPIDAGMSRGYWNLGPTVLLGSPKRELIFSPEGNRLFDHSPHEYVYADYKQRTESYNKPMRECRLWTKLLEREVLEVTGITDEELSEGKIKIVNYTWNWKLDSLPKSLREFLGDVRPTRDGNRFRLYDDGWRIMTGRMIPQ